jgi:threonine aldolase
VHAIDFRSDTITQPTAAMRDAMAGAEVGDDVFGDDPTVNALQELAAERMGKPAALFVPSGTMANQVALGAWTEPGDEIVIERSAHIVQWEAGAPGKNHGLTALTLHAENGVLAPDELRRVARMKSVHCPRTALVCVEQTCMGSGNGPGGRVVPLDALRATQRTAHELGARVHMDGARLANAVVASGVGAREWAATADSVSICLSKGLGAPVGSLVAGPADFLERGRRVRKRLGGWMRQAGWIAAAGRFALEHQVERLARDHALARALAEVCDARPGLACDPAAVETNIVMVAVEHPDWDAARLARALDERGVRVLPMNATSLRFVTHLDVGPADVERLQGALVELLGG